MGNEASSDYCGYRVLSVQPNSPGEEAGLDPYFDFVVAANNVQLLSEDNVFLDIISEHEAKDLELIVYNSKRDETRSCTIKPTRDWGGNGLLGITIRFDSFENAHENVIHILTVKPNSPADRAGINPGEDYILGTAEAVFHDMDELAMCFEANINKPIGIYVYSATTGEVRVVSLTPRMDWGGYGLLGCDVGHGYLHRLPLVASAPSKFRNVQTTMGPGVLKETRADGVNVIELKWRLAHGAKAMLYTRS
jgi:hypothetical protein